MTPEHPATAPPAPEPPAATTGAAALMRQLSRQHRVLHAVKSTLSRGVSEADKASTLLLVTLAEQGPVRAGALAEAVHSDPSTVSRQTAELVAQGLVERQPDPADGRASRLAVTAAGHERVAFIHARRRALFAEVLRDWDAGDVDRLTTYLSRLNDDLDRVRTEVVDGTSPLLTPPSPAPTVPAPAEAHP
ncbi:MarR family winged helix-turn-helix transcriptional regulator [Kineococcus glutinatus]|uniref:HTH marR-type domain-containing protein n=1 Tax=Kineococcus glutinatus TaxID=1070872 RepID=A0ABP9H644_9ACTN